MERKTYIDIAKGVALLLVVMQHIGGILNIGIIVLCKADVSWFIINFFETLILAIIVTYFSIAIGKLLTFATPLNRILTT